jgi:6-pyruvoyl-tetrahydropterin synthase related domain
VPNLEVKAQDWTYSSGTMLTKNTFARHPYLLIAIVATLAALPVAFHGNPWGHDINLHLRSWMDAERQLQEGSLFPRWAAGANQGFGEPFFIFYPPLSRLIGVALGLVLPWKVVPGVFIWLMLMLAGAAMWICAREWLAPADALVASLLFAVNPYLVIVAYKRANYADLLAAALFPLMVWGGIRMGYAPGRTALPLSAAFAALWLSDLPAAVVASYALAGLLVLNAILYRSLRPLLFGALSIMSAFGSIAFFLFPAAWERRWVSIAEAVRPEWAPENNFLFTHSNQPQYVAFNRGLSYVTVFLVLATAIAAVFARRLRRDESKVWLSLTLLGAVSTFMMFPPSFILYETLPEMRYVEFPWRWLSALCVACAFLVATAISQARRKWIPLVIAGLSVAAIGIEGLHTVNWDTHRYLEGLVADAHSTEGYPIRFGDWSNPLGSFPWKLDRAAPLVAADGPVQPAQIQIEQWQGQRKTFSVESAQPLLLKLRLLSYPAWQAKVNGNAIPLQAEPELGQMLVPVPAGASHVEIRFARTWDRTIGNIVSLLTIVTCVPLMLWLGKREASHGPRAFHLV